MQNIKNIHQKSWFDEWEHISPKKREILDNSWPGLFKKEILPVLPVNEISKFFHVSLGRKTKELYAMLGALLLQQMYDLTDPEAVNSYIFDERWQYALDRHERNEDTEYICEKTLWNFRNIAMKSGSHEVIFQEIATKLAKVFKVDASTQRIDSVHINSNMSRMNRVAICAKSIKIFLKNLQRQDKTLFSQIDKELVKKYLPKKALQCFSMVKPSESKKRINEIGNDLYVLIKNFKDIQSVASMYSYTVLERILKEQFIIKKTNGKQVLKAKKPQDIPSDSLQNPSDPNAAFSGHKGQGYQLQLMETVCKDKEKKEQTLNLITYAEVEQANKSDAKALMPAVESTKKQKLAPKELTADQAYGSDKNCEAAQKQGVEVVSPVKNNISENSKISLSEFDIDTKGKISKCPLGVKPVRAKKRKRFSIAFDSGVCGICPNCSRCPVESGKKYFYIRYTKKDLRIALRRQYEKTDEFKDRYRWRSGVEAAFSELNRKTGAKRLRVRGFAAVCFALFLKVAGLNVLRAARVKRVRKKPDSGGDFDFNSIFSYILDFKDQFKQIFSHFGKKILFFHKSEFLPPTSPIFRF